MPRVDEILKDIDALDWSRFQHACGDAGDVPGMLRGLVSENELARQEALYQLCGTIWHQGTVYEASPHTVPFLLDMLRAPGVPDKAYIALLLADLADGTAALEPFAGEGDELGRQLRDYLEDEGRDFAAELAAGRAYVQATCAAVGLGIDLLLPYLSHDEPEVRSGVARALARYPGRAGEFLPLLEKARDSETEAHVRASFEEAITKLKEEA